MTNNYVCPLLDTKSPADTVYTGNSRACILALLAAFADMLSDELGGVFSPVTICMLCVMIISLCIIKYAHKDNKKLVTFQWPGKEKSWRMCCSVAVLQLKNGVGKCQKRTLYIYINI